MASTVGADMNSLKSAGTKKMAQVQPGDYIVPLGGEAEKNLVANNDVPLFAETLKVISKPYPIGKRVGVKVECMDRTKMYLRLPPEHRLAVFA